MFKFSTFIFFLAILPILGMADPVEGVISTMDFEIHGGLILFKVEVDGKEQSFLLDSGAPSIILNQKVSKSSAVFSTIEGDILATKGEIEEIRIGNIHKTHVSTWIMDLSHIEKRLGVKIDGLIGADIFSSYDLLIDYKGKKISFLASGKLNDLKPTFSHVVVLPFISHYENLPVVNINLKGEELRMSFDTGAGITVFSKGILDDDISIVKEIALGSLKIQSMPVLQSNTSQFIDEDGNRLDGILSVNSLNADHVLISSKRKSIFLFWDNLFE